MHDPELETERPAGASSTAQASVVGGAVPSVGQEELPPISEIIAAIAAKIPAEEWEKVPADLSSRADHYLRA